MIPNFIVNQNGLPREAPAVLKYLETVENTCPPLDHELDTRNGHQAEIFPIPTPCCHDDYIGIDHADLIDFDIGIEPHIDPQLI